MDLLIARNPDPDSFLPYLVRVPVSGGLVFRTKGTWPRTTALYCHPVPGTEWPAEPEIVETVALRSCERRGEYGYQFRTQQVTTAGRALGSGDYAISVNGVIAAAVERKSLDEGVIVQRMGAGANAALDGPDMPLPATAELRKWARNNGITVPDRGKLRPEILDAWRSARGSVQDGAPDGPAL